MATRRTHPSALAAAAALLLAALPRAGDAGIAPTGDTNAACFANAGAPPPPGATGDEPFFKLPAGTPNVMIVLDTSGSMLDFPVDLPYPAAWPASLGTCSIPALDALSAKRTSTPYDNGYSTALMTDDPPWGLNRCTVTQPSAPTTDAAYDSCMFRGTSHYKFNGQQGIGFENTRARTFNASPCGAFDSNGNRIPDYTTGVMVPLSAQDVDQCRQCLEDKGYYLFRKPYRTSTGTNRVATQAVFTGEFMNVYPPKYVSARKVVKDVVKLDPSAPANTDNVRFGLTRFNPSNNSGTTTGWQTNDGGLITVPLGPNCDQSFPVSDTAYATVRQAIVDAVNNTTYVGFGGTTPLAETLLQVGQYFSNAGSGSLFNTLFGAGWVKTGFAETARGAITAPWTGTGQNQHSFCWACQNSSVVVVTDGAPVDDNNLPRSGVSTNHSTFNNDFRRWTNATVDCATCGAGNLLHKVAYFLSQTDLRPDLLNGSRPQNLYTYTISFGLTTATDAEGIAILQKTAQLGNGLFFNTSSGEELREALDTAVADIVDHQLSFSSTNANALQVSKTVSADAYLGRFRPSNHTMWEGHLFAGQIFDEFGQGCDARFSQANQKLISCGTATNVNPNLDGKVDADSHAVCDAAYVVDQDCDPIFEDASGSFLKATFDPATHELLSTPDPATMWWDAGRVLSDPAQPGYKSADETAANARAIYTTLDLDRDGKFTRTDVNATHAPQGLLPFTVDNALALAPHLGLDLVYCQDLLRRIGACDSDAATATIPACPTLWNDTTKAQCAKQIIYFIRGYDVLDWDGDYCAGPDNPRNTASYGTCTTAAQCAPGSTCVSSKCVPGCTAAGEQRDRTADSRATNAQNFWKLGDVFHSSPVLVKPPLPKEICRFGLENQCVLTLFGSTRTSNPTPMEQTYSLTDCKSATREVDAYDKWRYDNRNRSQLVLVGANDGMLHAFDAGSADVSKSPDFYCQNPQTSGSGSELWAYIPPSQLPRLKKALDAHTYFVDGNTMVRDVWVDDNVDGVKQADEYHTIAIMSERGGGVHYTALDITDPTAPEFLWQFPENGSDDVAYVGQAWNDFLPRPPPIGPVRLALGAGATNDPNGRGWEERWIVMLNGGYDPTLVRGRAVFMLDVWTGKKLWRYTDETFKDIRGDAAANMMPVAATVAMVDIGKADQPAGQVDIDAFFDTATWGDLGGNLFVARFHDPGEIDPGTGLVTNWYAARAFETNRQANDTMPAAQRGAFFFMTANALDGPSRLMTYVGTGNREKLLAEEPTCGPNNLLGCCQAGCSVATSTTTMSLGACSGTMSFSCSGGNLSFSMSGSGTCPATCSGWESEVTVDYSCGAAGDPAPLTSSLTCGATGSCSVDTPFSSTAEFSLAALTTALPQEKFYGIWSYGKAPSRRFDSESTARDFDGNRFTDVAFLGCDDVPDTQCKLVDVTRTEKKRLTAGGPLVTTCPTSKCEANSQDPGFMYLYGVACPSGTCAETSWDDERTGAGAAVSQSCLQWSSFRPTGATGGTDPCTSSVGTPTSLNYLSDFVTGVPRAGCGFADDPTSPDEYVRATVHDAFAPPQNPSPRVVVNDRGQVSYGTLRIESGRPAEKTTSGVRSSVGEFIYRIEVDRALHTCRHVDPSTCE